MFSPTQSSKYPQLSGHNIVQILKFSFRQYVLCHQTILFFERFHTDRSWAFQIHFLRFRGIRFRIHLYFNVAASSSHNTVSTSPHGISVYLYLAPNRKQNPVTELSCMLKESISGSNISAGRRAFFCFFSADFIDRSVKSRVCCFSAAPSPITVGPVRVVIFQLYTDRLFS